jgi:hypothetical protein
MLVAASIVGAIWLQTDLAQERDWELVRTVSNPYGGPQDLILIPERKQRDRNYYLRIANEVCGDRASCDLSYWIDHTFPQAQRCQSLT